ncbi:hypothetical protein L1D44_04830 [Shewanella sp. Isolate13]|uniref:hypothetical protein n=1 Tax=Shewanella sp. Isolate13 TaxID=2908531 RepID=UPI001EFEE556|nr:hypothetical protein [Shewanella sp. Isolate13]MCG9729168.1 hypothetical protein [Shewanella sp. Isolate13]
MFSFFKKDLAKLVQRTHSSEFAFVDAYNDLGIFIDENPNPTPEVFMAYCYARRDCAAAFYLQGIWEYDQFQYTQNMFKAGQLNCGQKGLTKEFQEQAAKQSVEYLRKYVPQWQSLQLSLCTTLVIDRAVNPVITHYEHASDDELKTAVFMATTGIFTRFEPVFSFKDEVEEVKALTTYQKIDAHREFFLSIDKSTKKKTSVANIEFKEMTLGEAKDIWRARVLCSDEECTLVNKKLQEIEESIPNVFVTCITLRYQEGSPLGQNTISSE